MQLLLSIVAVVLAASSAPWAAHAGPLPLMHSHNDYNQKHPFFDAYNLDADSIEADIWLSDGEIKVSHLGFFYTGTLRELYLDPLQKLVDRNGSVYGDGRPVLLWLDLKQSGSGLREALHKLLAQYPMFTRFTNQTIEHRAVTAVLTGSETSKTAYIHDFPVRYACRDSNKFRESDPDGDAGWSWYALRWEDYVDWDGKSQFDSRAFEQLKRIISISHAKGRKVRFWSVPESENTWAALANAGVDVIGADDIKRLRNFLDSLHFSSLANRPLATLPY